MIRFNLKAAAIVVAVAAIISCASTPAWAVPFQIGFNSGTPLNTNHLYGQGFSPAVRANPDPFTDPMLGLEDTVRLDKFSFFKSNYFFESPPGSGTFVPLVATNLQLAIVNNFFMNLDTLTTTSPELVGISTNTIATTATIATGDPLDFNFDSLELSYGAVDYAAIFVRNDGAGNLDVVDTPVLVATYAETSPGSGTFVPTVDYGDPAGDFIYAASNFITVDVTGSYLRAFDPPHADARFIAYFDQEAAVNSGDYNGDLKVDALDYTVWRNNLNDPTEADINNNGNGTGGVDEGDFTLWKLNYGAMYPPGGGGGGIAVPEPGTVALVSLASMTFVGAVGRRRR